MMQTVTTDEKKTIKIAELIAAIPVCAFVLSIFYEKGFFHVVGRDFFYLLSISDFVASAIYWLPAIILQIFIGILIGAILGRSEHWQSEEDIINGSKNSKFTGRFRRSGNTTYFFVFLVIVPIHFLLIDSEKYLGLVFTFFAAVFLIARWFLNSPRCPYRAIHVFIFASILPILVLSYALGHDTAKELIKSGSAVKVTANDGNQHQLIRKFDSGALIQNADKSTIQFIKSDDIKRIFMNLMPNK